MNRPILFAALVVLPAVAAPVAAQPFTPVGPAVLANQGYQYASNDLAYSDKQNIYLMVQGHPFVGGRFVGADGQLIGTQFDIARQSGSDAESRTAYSAGSADDVFLVTFRSELGGGTQIYGRLVMYAGGNPVLGPLLGMTELSTPSPIRQVAGGIAFDPANRRFFVTWEDYRLGAPRIFGRFWGLSGSGANTTMSPLTGDVMLGGDIAGSPNVAFDPQHGVFMVVYRGPHPENGAISGSFAKQVTFPGQVSGPIVLTAGNGEPGEQNIVYLPQVDQFLTVWTDITRLRDVSGRLINHSGGFVTGVFPILNTPSMEGAVDLGYSPITRSVLLAAMRDQTRYIQGVELTAAGAVPTTYDPYFIASTVLPAGTLESFFPNVAPAENGRFGLSYVNQFQFGYVEVLQGRTGGTPPPPPCTAGPATTSVSLTGAAQSQSIAVTASTADCPWTATSSPGWLTISSGASGAGPGTVTFSVTRNTTGAARTGTVSIGSGGVTIHQAVAVASAAVHDVSGDRLSDLIWHNQSTGQIAAWNLVGNTAALTYHLSGAVDTSWKVVGSGDFNSDGYADLAWRQSGTGRVAVWYLQAGSVLSTHSVIFNGSPAVELDPNWEIRAVGDLDGDGHADLVWQQVTSGSLGVWFMRGFTVTSIVPLSAGTSGGWRLAAASDINADGKADLLWHNETDGRLGAWLMHGNQVGVQSGLSVARVSDLNWKLRGAGDVNGDGIADLFWQHTSTGAVGIWYLSGFNVVATYKLPFGVGPAAGGWRMVGPG